MYVYTCGTKGKGINVYISKQRHILIDEHATKLYTILIIKYVYICM